MATAGMQTLSRESIGDLLGGARGGVERMPMLRTLLERTGVACSEDVRGLIALPARVVLQDIRSAAAGEMLTPYVGKGVIGLLGAPGWNAQLIACAAREDVFTMVELLLGGDGSQPVLIEDRPPTAIETRVAGVLFAAIGKALAGAFAPISQTDVVLESTSDKADFDIIDAKAAMVAAHFRLEALGRNAEILLAVPQSALTAMGKALTVPAAKAAPPRPDARWTADIQKELNRAAVKLTATLEERPGILGEIINLRVGQVVPLDATPQTRLQVECNGERLMWCHLGKSNGFYTLRVDSFVDREQEFMDDILAA